MKTNAIVNYVVLTDIVVARHVMSHVNADHVLIPFWCDACDEIEFYCDVCGENLLDL